MSASENGHTPGPWRAVPGGSVRADDVRVADVDGVDIAEMEANARLIATAPEMHKTGRKLANEVGGIKAFEHEVRAIIGNTNWSVLMQRLAEADAVLSKAEGRQP
jgi:hypothetical protein